LNKTNSWRLIIYYKAVLRRNHSHNYLRTEEKGVGADSKNTKSNLVTCNFLKNDQSIKTD